MCKTPSELKIPAYLMNFPFTVDNSNQNNALMKDKKEYNYDRAFLQFLQLYSLLVGESSLVYLLPSEKELQDLPYVANIGCYLPHLKKPTIVVSNFKSPPRKGEANVGIKFFESMRYEVYRPSTFWEGEADLKYLYANVYIAGYGIRSEDKTYKWMAEKFKMKIIPVEMTDEKLYHFDCLFFPLEDEKALVAVSALDKEDLKLIEKVVDVIEVPKKYIYDGWTNAIRIDKKVLYHIPVTEDSRTAIDNILIKAGYEPVGVNIGEFDKSGASLSCLIMHLNYNGRNRQKVIAETKSPIIMRKAS